MNKAGILVLKSGLVVVVLTIAMAGLLACNSKTKTSEPSTVSLYIVKAADLKAGAQLSQKGNASGAAACIACHGAAGEGQAGSGFPRLANQSRMYLANQLHNFKDGSRNNAVMMPIAKGMTDQEIEDVSAYLESLPIPSYATSKKMTANELSRGRQLAEVGDAKIAVQSCANCHGPGGIGQPPAIPYLKGQFAPYIEAQLMAWKNGTRQANADHMGLIAKMLSEQDVKTMAAYFEKLPSSKVLNEAPEQKYTKSLDQ